MAARAYRSVIRQRQAEQTRARILEAARAMMLERGFAATTLEQMGTAAGVAPQTVRAVFGTKPGVLAALVERATFGLDFQGLIRAAGQACTPAEHIAVSAQITVHVFSTMGAELNLLAGAGTTVPRVRDLQRQISERRRGRQSSLIEHLVASGELRPGLDADAAADIVWALTSYDLFRMLVVERGWSTTRYESWLVGQLNIGLLAPCRGRAQSERDAPLADTARPNNDGKQP